MRQLYRVGPEGSGDVTPDVMLVAAKDVVLYNGGDTAITRLIARLLAEDLSVTVACLSDDPSHSRGLEPDIPVRRFQKSTPGLGSVVRASAQSRRSPIHARFRDQCLREFLVDSHATRVVFEHTYMAENASLELLSQSYVNTHVSESSILARGRGTERLLAPWTRRDEERILVAAAGVAVFDPTDVTSRVHSLRSVHQIDLVFPSAGRTVVEDNAPVAVFLGDRSWLPNFLGAKEAISVWRHIRDRVEGAELWIVGRGPMPPEAMQTEGVRSVGFVDDLEKVLRSVRFMFAPIALGGGVRVKLLDAASVGVPFVGSLSAVGTVSSYLDVRGWSSAEMIEEGVRLLTERAYARRASRRLYDSNWQWENDGKPKRQLLSWLEL